jgi:hypothetical protein
MSGTAIEPGGHGLVVGGAYDGRYRAPAGAALFQCGATSLCGGLANDRPVELALEDAEGRSVSSVGLAATAPRCPGGALERLEPLAPDETSSWRCPGATTPLACNRSTPAERCPRRSW